MNRQIKRVMRTKIGLLFLSTLCIVMFRFLFISTRWACLDSRQKESIFNMTTPMLFCCWHSRLSCLLFFLPKNRIFHMLRSEHADGGIGASFVHSFKMKNIPVSSKKGGHQAFIKMVRLVKNGDNIAIAPDGPRGPSGVIKDGIIKLAQLTGAPIIPLSWSSTWWKRTSSWDRFIIPLPFAKGVYAFGKPIYVQKKIDESEFEAYKLKVQKAMTDLAQLTDRATGQYPPDKKISKEN